MEQTLHDENGSPDRRVVGSASLQSPGCPFSGIAAWPTLAIVPAATRGVCFVALSHFTVVNGMTVEVKEAFRNRPHLVDHVAGFLGMAVLTPTTEPDEIWLLTYLGRHDPFPRLGPEPCLPRVAPGYPPRLEARARPDMSANLRVIFS